ncbi:MAG: universal stress protein [Ignavibacteriales bacterium]|nr:universal stress protein [Ignavibacteriales bacterium]MCF8435483.1 universal stress protein [Ignavibacteriales bacterium]
MYEFKKILVPLDFSDYSKKALTFAVDFAMRFNSQITLLYVLEPMIYPADLALGQITPPGMDHENLQFAEKELQKIQQTLIAGKIESEIIVAAGKPFFEINRTAQEINADLIIIATHGHTGVEHILFGSTAEKVVRKAPCPVLTLREPIKGFQFKP